MKDQQLVPFKTLAKVSDSIVLFIDHQSVFMQTIENVPVATVRNTTSALATAATLLGVPVIITSIDPEQNGRVLPEIIAGAPNAVHIVRAVEINAWDHKEFVQAVKATKAKTLIICGIWTSVCATFPALSALQEHFTVYLVTDACGDVSQEAHENAIRRCTQAGALPVTANSIIAELQGTWDRPEAGQLKSIYAEIIPRFKIILEGTTQSLTVS
ncbi:isochorismatase family protein [Fibrisoma limi]|uniref:isochorismatase family protein n=1 Tax=Fibrisoma limi TaxID=663275 RepID=UPI0005875452|nr:isochorismatase family protein [Fibrisoma limi]